MTEEARWGLAILLAAGVMYLPAFAWHMLTIPPAIFAQSQAHIAQLEHPAGADVIRAIRSLEGSGLKIEGGTDDDYAGLLGLEFAEPLAVGGVSPDAAEYGPYLGLNGQQLRRFLAELRALGIVDVQQRVVEEDRGYPYTTQDFFLSDFGARVVAELRRQWDEAYTDDE